MSLLLPKLTFGIAVLIALALYVAHDQRRITAEHRKLGDHEPLLRVHSGVKHSSIGWFAVGVPSLWQTKYSYADRFQPCVITLDGRVFHLYDAHNRQVFSCDVSSQRITYGQMTGNFRFRLDKDYVVSVADSNLYPQGLFVSNAAQWARWLGEAGADVKRRSVLLR